MALEAGYSGTPLPKKLGIKAGHRVLLDEAPPGFVEDWLVPMPDGVVLLEPGEPPFDVAVLFATELDDLVPRFEATERAMEVDGGLWVAWPKQAAKVATDLDFAVVQGLGLDAGLVDNKSCAVTDVWSGLRFVVRVANRSARSGKG